MVESLYADLKLRHDLKIIADLVQPGHRVLDLGCGDGSFLKMLRETRGAEILGMEIEHKLIGQCIANGVPVIQGDLNDGLDFAEENSFDLVILSGPAAPADCPGRAACGSEFHQFRSFSLPSPAALRRVDAAHHSDPLPVVQHAEHPPRHHPRLSEALQPPRHPHLSGGSGWAILPAADHFDAQSFRGRLRIRTGAEVGRTTYSICRSIVMKPQRETINREDP